MQPFTLRRILPFAVAAAFAASAFATPRDFDYPDHYEFEASLQAPYRANAGHARAFDMQFRFPGAEELSYVAWRVDLVDANGFELRTWRGESPLADGAGKAAVSFSEREAQLADGIYPVRMRAYALNPLTETGLRYRSLDERVEATLLSHAQELEDQTFDIQIGNVPKPAMPAFKALPTGVQPQLASNAVAATGGLPYTVYLGNLHSQTNLSDGGGPLSTCVSEQNPQSGVGSPTDAYTYAMNEGLDFLMTSEHNHMFDGSTSTNASANPTTAHNLYQSGQTMRDNFNAAHPNFLALAGLEWGVISNGGHLNIFNTPQLLEWEYNSSNQLIGDVYTAKGDYASLYTLMKTNGWVGQFNHPATTGQFQINGTALAYSADGDQAMALCEVMNSSAFSHNTTETETSLNSYEAACNILLEAGYHVAFSSDQDNHCAQWGASYTNRTGVLIPNGQALNQANFLAALQARHVYATYDKASQVVLTTDGGHIMGDRFNHSGALTLTVNYAPGAGRSASQVQIFEGVPGSNGTVTQTSTTAVTTITPANGDHFYYAKITQDNGTLLYSAPVWVTQGAAATDFGISASPTSTSVTQGASTTDAITINAQNGFNGSVALSASGLPAGVTASFSPSSTTSSSTLTLTASGTATTGTATVTISGTSGSISHATSLSLTVNPATASIPRYDHVIVVIEENTSESTVIGNTAQAPYINSLAAAGANFTQSFAVTHPSQPNYLALFSGSTQGVTDDTCPQSFAANNLGNQLITAGFTFAGYSETMPSNGYTGCTSGTSGYARKHNPWSDFTDLAATTNLAYTSFPTDFTTLPTLSFVIPNLCDDMHDCALTTGDTWLKNNLDAYATWAKTHNSLLIVTWDEDDSTTSANQIATIFVGANVKPGTYTETINHYSVLRTLENMYGLSALGSAASATPITDVWASGADTTPPSVNATESGTSGTITLSATATDNVSVTKVEFYVDGVLKGTDTTSPFSMTLDSTTLSNASHSLVAKAYDAAGNVGTSSTVTFSINNTTGGTPTASFSFTTNGLVATFTDASTDAGGTIGTHSWNFGDGATSTTASPSHTYAAAGTYTVTETVADSVNTSATNTATKSVTVSVPNNVLQNGVGITISDATVNHQQNWTMPVPAGATSLVFAISGGTGDADLYVKFGSAPTTSSYDCRPYVSGNSESCPITTAQAGTYYVMVNTYAAYSGVTLKGSYTAPGSGGTPTANFTFTTSGLTANFTDTSTDAGGAVGTHSWSFGDGSSSTTASPSHTYAAAGTYTVTETVADSINKSATSTKTASVTVSISGGTPTANFTFTTTGLTANFTDTSTDAGGTIGTHSWNFGDGGAATTASPSHTYAAAGTYTVTETVADSVNTSATSTKTASVSVSVPTSTQLLGNTGFETTGSWTTSSGVISNNTTEPPHAGSYDAWMDGYGSAHTDTLTQTVTIPAGKTSGTLQFYLHIDTAETGSTAYDKLTVKVGSTTVATFSNVNAAAGYQVHSYNVPVTAGSSVTVSFSGVEDASLQTSFVVDDVTFTVQ
jgi:PKD repeat protein